MKYVRIVAAFVFALLATSAAAQWQVPDNATPIGRGGGATGFDAVGPCAAGTPIVGNPPACGNVDIATAVSRPVRVVTAAGAVNVLNTDYLIVVNKTVGEATVANLPAGPASGDLYVIKDGKGDAWLNNITVTPAAGTIDGAATFAISVAYGSVTFIYNGTQWNVQ